MKVITVKSEEIKLNPNNPRLIKEDSFKKLVKSVEGLPQMLEMRPIIVDDDMIILGGNMRYQACVRAGINDIPVVKYTKEEHKKTKAFEDGMSYEDACREIIIKDNVGFGEWDWDILGNEWNTVELSDWGLEVWQNEDDIETSDEFSLPDGDKGNLEQITYTLSSEQSNIIKDAIQEIKHTEEYKYVETFGNENSNGNALYLLISQWVEQKK
tara:strand:- start:1877 stop:2512 length:636 start_codon:yes stop_codon:yes gene_type:complete